MKKVMLGVVMLMGFLMISSSTAYANGGDNSISIDIGELAKSNPALAQQLMQAKDKIESNAVSDSVVSGAKKIIEDPEEWGKSIGTALDSVFKSLNTNVNEFADTKVGIFVAGIVAWKVLGDDIFTIVMKMKNIILGIPFWIAFNFLIAWAYKRQYVGKYVKVKNKDGGVDLKHMPAYEFDSNDARGFVGFLFIAIFVVFNILFMFVVL